jgi:carbonic anhydrase
MIASAPGSYWRVRERPPQSWRTHHSFCGTTTLTPELIVEEFHDHHHADISTLFDHDNLAIMDFEESLNHDIKLLRKSPAVPKHIKLYGFFYEISSGKLTEVVRDVPA